MLSLIRPSSSPCLHPHPDSFLNNGSSVPPLTSSSSTTSPSSTTTTTSTTTPPSPSFKPNVSLTATTTPSRPSFKSSASAPLNSASYKELVAQFTARAPQPYGVIPPRRKRPSQGLVRSSSASSLLLNTSTAATNTKTTASSPPSPTESSRNALELQPTSLLSRKHKAENHHCMTSDSRDNSHHGSQIMQPLFHSLQSLLPESTSSSTRLGFWANLKAHYLAATTTTLSWPGSGSAPTSASASGAGIGNTMSSAARASAGLDEFSPPIALRLSNSTPVASVDPAEPLSASLTFADALLSLPNLATPSAHAYHVSAVNFPVSVAAMDKFKPIRSDTIPLKTFTYHETPVVERPQPLPLPLPLKRDGTTSTKTAAAASKTTTSLSPPVPLSPATDSAKEGRDAEMALLPALPRHLATRETRSNADYLRMMAAELRMIRSRKLVSPLKPRGYLPRRKDPFRNVKSPLCRCIELPRVEDDHPLNDIMVGSWSSISSADSFLSSASSEYQSANEGFC